MKMHQKFALKLSANLPETGFSLDELVIETKKLFETEGMVGFLRVLQKPELTLAAGADDATSAAHPADSDKPPLSAKRIAWAQLLKRVFNIDVTVCSKCKGKVKIIAAIEDPKVIKKILGHMGLPSTVPRLAPARGPPVSDQYDMQTQEFF